MTNKNFVKITVTALLAGLVGGGLAYGSINLLNADRQSSSSISIPTGTNTTNVRVNINSQATKVFQDNKAAVVSVVNLQRQDRSSEGSDNWNENDSSSSNDNANNLEEYSEGSGLIYKKNSHTAYVVTNDHVVSGSSAVRVIMSNGTRVSAKIIGTDAVTDLAVLEINSDKVTTPAPFGNSSNIKVGEAALAVGSPLGSNFATTLTKGVVSAKERTIATTNSSGQTTGYATVIQTDAAINSGNSGGPLFNVAGQVIGINAMKLTSDSSGASVEGMGFAIPSNEVVTIIDKLEKDGKVIRPALGAATYDLDNISTDDRKSVLKLPANVTEGVVIMKVYSESPAQKAGLKKHDVLVELGNKKTYSLATLRSALYNHSVGDSVKIKYYREGTLKTSTIKLTKSTASFLQ